MQSCNREREIVRKHQGIWWCWPAVLLAIVSETTPVMAQQTDRALVEQKLRDDKARLAETQNRSRQLQLSVAEINKQREELNTRLIDTGNAIQDAESRMTTIEERLGNLTMQREQAQERLFKSYASLSTLLASMQRIGRNPPPVIVTRRKDALEMVRSAMLMARAFPHLQTKAAVLGKELGNLEALIASIGAKRKELGAETTRLASAQAALKSLLEVKKRTVSEQQQQLEQVQRSSAEIAHSVDSLAELIAKLDTEVRDKTGLGAYEKRERTEEPKVAALPPPKAPGAAFEYKPSSAVFKGMPGRLKPAIAFHKAKAMLPLPAVGKKVAGFGDKTELGTISKGIALETRDGAQITAPCDGWVVYAGVFRSYKQLLIINAGDGYHVLLAGLSNIDVQVGQFVLSSEPVGTMDVKRKGKSQDSAPVLYVEFRKEGRPIDPEPWWFKDTRKVQG